MSAEHALNQEIDSIAPKLVRELIQRFPNLLPLPEKDRLFLARMILRTVLRNPVTLRWATLFWPARFAMGLAGLRRRLQTGKEIDPEKMRYGSDRIKESKLFHRIATMAIDKHIRPLAAMQFVFVVPEDTAPNFILVSQPFLLKPSAPRSDFRVSLTLHPRLMLGLSDSQNEDKILVASNEDVRRINGLAIKYSSSLVMVRAEDAEGAWYRDFGREHLEDEITHVFVSRGQEPN